MAVNKDNGKYYIGKRVSYVKNLTEEYCENEIYYGSGVSLPKYGLKEERDYQFERSKHFTKNILHIGTDYEEKEELFLELYDAENDPNSYNRTNSGQSKGTTLNKIAINKDGEIRFVSDKQLSSFIDDGWSLGTGLRTLFKNDEIKKVPSNQLQDFLAAGWTTINPNPSTKDKKWLNKDGVSIMIHISKLDSYIADGWLLGCVYTGNSGKFFVMNNSTGDRCYIDPEELDEYLKLGYVRCSSNPLSNKGTVHVYKGENRLMIDKSEVEKYLSNGYTLGRSFSSNKGKIHIIKDSEAKIIPESQLESYLAEGWVRGSYVKNTHSKGRIWINNGKDSKLIYIEDLDKHILSGYVKGRGKLK